MKSLRKSPGKFLLAAAMLSALAPAPIFACATCGSGNPYATASPLTNGMNLGIVTLFGVILTVLTCFAVFFVHLARGEKAQAETGAKPPPQNPSSL